MRDGVRRFFDDRSDAWLSRYYRRDFDALSYQDRMAEAFRLLDRHAGAGLRVLDVGCGAGVQAALLDQRGHEVFACDMAFEMSRKASRQIGRKAVVAVGERLPFAPESFDVVIALGVIGYSTEPHAFLQSLLRVLRPGGMLVISSVGDRRLLSRLSEHVSRWPDALYRWAKARLLGCSLPCGDDATGFYRSHLRYIDARAFDSLLDTCGFERLSGSGVDFGRLRFMGKPIMGDAAAVALTRGLTRLSRRLPLLHRCARIYVAAVRKPVVQQRQAAAFLPQPGAASRQA